MGIFSSLGGALKKANAPRADGTSFLDRLDAVGNAFLGDPDPSGDLRKRADAVKQRALEQSQEAQFQKVFGRLFGEGAPSAPAPVQPHMQGPGFDGDPVAPPQAQAPTPASVTPMPTVPSQADALRYLGPMMASPKFGPRVSAMLGAIREAQPKPPKPPTRFTTPTGIVEFPADGQPKQVYTFPAKPENLPSGMVRNPQTNALEWDKGYLDAQSALAGGRRAAVVAHPMPSRGGGGGGGGARPHSVPLAGRVIGPSLPAGY